MTRGTDFEDIPKVCPNVEIIRHELLKATVVGIEIVARIWTSHTRPTQSHVEEVYWYDRDKGGGWTREGKEREIEERKREKRREKEEGAERYALYLNCDITTPR